jgi:hypothetical protein
MYNSSIALQLLRWQQDVISFAKAVASLRVFATCHGCIVWQDDAVTNVAADGHCT